MICPKCAFEQPQALECARCGIIIGKYRPEPPAAGPAAAAAGPPATPAPPPPRAAAWPSAPVAGTQGLGAGAVLAETFGIYLHNLGPFLAIGTLAVLPLFGQAVWLAFGSTALPGIASAKLVDRAVDVVMLVIAQPLATAAMTYGVFQHMRGRQATFSDCLRVGLRCLLPALGVAILYFFAWWAAFALCILPVLWVMTVLSVAIPVAVEEKRGPIAACQRSAELTLGRRWTILGVIVVLVLIKLGISITLGVLFLRSDSPSLEAFLDAGTAVPTTGLAATAAAVMYYRLRSVTETVPLGQIASVFD